MVFSAMGLRWSFFARRAANKKTKNLDSNTKQNRKNEMVPKISLLRERVFEKTSFLINRFYLFIFKMRCMGKTICDATS